MGRRRKGGREGGGEKLTCIDVGVNTERVVERVKEGKIERRHKRDNGMRIKKKKKL